MPRVTRDFADDDLVELRRAARELSFLAELARVTASAIESNDLFQLIIGETCRVLGVQVCSLYVVQEGDLLLAATNGLNPAGVGVARMPIGVGITGEAARLWRRLTESRSDLLPIVSHDVRTPLAIALTYVEALYERLSGEERTVIDQVRTELGHVGRMVETVHTAPRRR